MVCDGLDTVSVVYINDEEVGRSINMFVRYIFDVKHALHVSKFGHIAIIRAVVFCMRLLECSVHLRCPIDEIQICYLFLSFLYEREREREREREMLPVLSSRGSLERLCYFVVLFHDYIIHSFRPFSGSQSVLHCLCMHAFFGDRLPTVGNVSMMLNLLGKCPICTMSCKLHNFQRLSYVPKQTFAFSSQ